MAEAGTVRDFEAQVYRADHSIIWITENARCVRAPDGAIFYYEGTVEDITQRKADEENIRLLATVFESVGEGTLIVDRNLVVKAVNPAYEPICGLADLLGFDVVAEGVETDKQVKILRSTRCDVFQGYLFSRPVTASQFAAFVQDPANR